MNDLIDINTASQTNWTLLTDCKATVWNRAIEGGSQAIHRSQAAR